MKDNKIIWHEPTEQKIIWQTKAELPNTHNGSSGYGAYSLYRSDNDICLEFDGKCAKVDDLLELSEEKGNVTQYKRIAQMLNNNLKFLIEKCSMLKDMDWVEQYKVATDMADKALKEIDSKKASQ